MKLEAVRRPLPTPAGILRDFGVTYAANGLIGFLFAASGPVAIILSMGTKGGLDQVQLASWVFGAFFFNSILTSLFCILYRTPLVFFWTIPGTVLVGESLTHLAFEEVVGAYILTGVLMLVIGLTGWVRQVMNLVPLPIVMAMVAGVFLQFGLDLVLALHNGFFIAAPMVTTFLVLSIFSRLGRILPPLIGSLIFGILAVTLFGDINEGFSLETSTTLPALVTPRFSISAAFELVIPLAITVIIVQNGQGVAILKSARHDPPVNAITSACGGVSILAAAVGTVSTCLTGPTNALISSTGERNRQYTSGLFIAMLGLLFGLFSGLFTQLMLATPAAFIATLAGLAMLRVLQNSMMTAFEGKCTLGALVTFLVTLTNIPLLNLGAPFWGLLFGCAVSWLLERQDYQEVTVNE